MAASANDAMMDAALNWVKNNSTRLCVCTSQPTTYAQATASYKIADVSISASDFGSPTSGDSSGRKIQVNAQNSVLIDSTGSANWVALVKVASSQLNYVTDTASTGLTAAGNVNIGAWDIEIADPT